MKTLKIIRWDELKGMIGLSRSTIWRLERSDCFPKRRKLGSSSVGWIEHEIIQWIADREIAFPERADNRNFYSHSHEGN